MGKKSYAEIRKEYFAEIKEEKGYVPVIDLSQRLADYAVKNNRCGEKAFAFEVELMQVLGILSLEKKKKGWKMSRAFGQHVRVTKFNSSFAYWQWAKENGIEYEQGEELPYLIMYYSPNTSLPKAEEILFIGNEQEIKAEIIFCSYVVLQAPLGMESLVKIPTSAEKPIKLNGEVVVVETILVDAKNPTTRQEDGHRKMTMLINPDGETSAIGDDKIRYELLCKLIENDDKKLVKKAERELRLMGLAYRPSKEKRAEIRHEATVIRQELRKNDGWTV